MSLSPTSPSLQKSRRRRGSKPATFASYDAIETLLAEAVVGKFKYLSVAMKYRAVSRRMRDAVDRSVDQWCRVFVRMQKQRVRFLTLRMEEAAASRGKWAQANESYYGVVVEMEKLVKKAFGSCTGVLRNVVHLSKVDRETYYGAATRRCVLCGNRIFFSSNVEDAEGTWHAPVYAFAHPVCQRKNMVVITGGQNAIPRGAEPRDLHKELFAVDRLMKENPHGPSITRADVLSRMSDWYKSNASPRRSTTPLMVWLRPHARVNPQDTLYGALGITRSMVEAAVELTETHWRTMREQSDARRLSVAKKTAELTEAYEAELRVWLGKGQTRWRSLEDLESVHDSIMSSTHIDRLIDASMKKCSTVNMTALFNSLRIFSRTVDYMDSGVDPAVMDWLVRCVTIYSVFGDLGYEMLYVDRAMAPVSIDNEAVAHARAIQALQNMSAASIESVSARSTFVTGLEAKYHVSVNVRISETLLVIPTCTMTHDEVCKLKYATSSEMPDDLAMQLPPLPDDEGDVAGFLELVLRACFVPTAGMARSIAMERLVDISMFKEILDSLVSEEAHGISDGDFGGE